MFTEIQKIKKEMKSALRAEDWEEFYRLGEILTGSEK